MSQGENAEAAGVSQSLTARVLARRRRFYIPSSQVDLVIADFALEELGQKLSHSAIEKLRRYVVQHAKEGVPEDSDVPICTLNVPKRAVGKAIRVQFFLSAEADRLRLEKLCIVAIDPEEDCVAELPPETEGAHPTQAAPTTPWRATAKDIMDEFRKQGVAAGIRETLRWMGVG